MVVIGSPLNKMQKNMTFISKNNLYISYNKNQENTRINECFYKHIRKILKTDGEIV